MTFGWIDLNEKLLQQFKKMSRNWLKPSSLFLIACRINDQLCYLGSHSAITNVLTLEKELRYSQIIHYLFQVEVHNHLDYNVPQKFYQPHLIKHKYSNKYLNYAQDMGLDNHQGCPIALSHDKVRWTVLPCFKYQIKNTQNIEHAERIYITEQNYQNQSNGSKNLFVKEHLNQENGVSTHEILFGFHFKTEFLLIKFHEDDRNSFHFGQCLKIYHQESYSFLVNSTPAQKMLLDEENGVHKWEVAFQNQDEKLGQSMLDCIWAFQDSISIKGAININGTIVMDNEVRIKNPITGHYLTLQDLSTDDQIYKLVGDKEESVYSVFKLENVKQEDRLITQKVQVRMKHSIIYQYMAVSQHRESHALTEIKMDKIAQDEHFYEFQPILFHQELTVYFLVSLKKELHNIYTILSNDISKNQLQRVYKLQINIQTDLQAIQRIFPNNELLKGQLNFFIPMIVKNVSQLWQISKKTIYSKEVYQIINLNNILLTKLAKDNLRSQIHVFSYIHIFLPCLFKELYVEQLLIQILKNNARLLSRLSDKNQALECNIIKAIVDNIDIQLKKDKAYWKKMRKIMELFQVIVKDYDKFIDINQRLIAIQMFSQRMLFDKLFFSIKIKNSLFYIHHPTSNIEMPINNFKEPDIRQIIGKTLQFMSSVCEDRNIISKKLVSNYLYQNQNEKDHEQVKKNKVQDIKTIINCFYIRNQGDIRSKIFLLQVSLYADSFPRLKRYRPVNVMRLDIQSLKVTLAKDAVSQMAELSSRLKESIMLKAERSYFSRPLTVFKSQTDNSYESIKDNEEPAFTNNQIAEYKKIVLLLLQTQVWNMQILKILRILLNLSILTQQQKITIYNKIFDKIPFYSSSTPIIKELLMVLQDLLKPLKQDKLQRIKHYFILMYFKEKKQLEPSDLKYIIQSGVMIKYNKKTQTPTNQFVSTRYNQITAQIHQYSKSVDTIESLLGIFLKNEYDTQTMLNFMELIKAISSPYYQTVSVLLNTSILGQQDLAQFSLLQSYSLEINNLTQISEEWLCNNAQNSLNYLRFSHLMDQVTNFMYQDYTLGSQQGTKYRKKHKISKFRQIIMKNIGMHQYLLNLLQINAYLLQGQTLRTVKRKVRIALQKCFGFLYQFCYKCEQNKDTLFLQMTIINKYINLIQVGQTQLWIHLIKDKKKLIQQASIEDIEKIIFKIVKDRTSSSYQSCDYNPLYIDQLMALVDINGKPFKPNIQKIAKVLEQPLIFKKVLYLVEDKKKRNEFCLQMYKLRIDPTQIPVIYQAKLIELFIYMIKQLGNKNSQLRRAFRSFIQLDYLFYLAALDDSFTQQGIPTDMIFVLKIEVLKMLSMYLSVKDIDNNVYQCIQITKFLEYYKAPFSMKQLRKQSMVDNEMLYFSYIKQYDHVVQYYLRNSLLFYNNYLKPIFIRLLQIFEKVPNRQQDDNYQLLLFLLNKQQLKQLKIEPEAKGLEKQIEVYMKWSNFMPMSSQPKPEEDYTKNVLFQVLTNEQTQKYLTQQKKSLYSIIEKSQGQFLVRVKSILTKISQNLQEFHQKPLYKLIFLLYEYIQYKINKKKKAFSYQPPSQVLSQVFDILIIPIIRLISLKQFDYNKVLCQKIYNFSLLIIYTILSYKIKLKKHEELLNFLHDQRQNGSGFLKCLRKAIRQMIDEETIDCIKQQINFAQSSLLLVSEQQRIEPLLSTLLFIKEICRHAPFTKYFKGQNSESIDFVQLIYTNLMTILSQGTKTINIQKVKRIQYLCETLGFMFNGCQKLNQSIVTNKQFIKLVEKFLKIDLLEQKQEKNDNQQSIINQISLVYQQTIPEYKGLLSKQLSFFRFKHFYVINCVKTSLLKVLLASTISNEDSIEKLKLHMSAELIKLNIIALHERALKYPSKSIQRAYLERFQDWRDIFNNHQEYVMSFTLSTYGFSLIKALQGELQSSQTDQQSKKVSQLGQMQIFMPQSMKLILRQLKDEPFFRDILLFYRKYFEAYRYFGDTFASVEIAADQKKDIIDVSFSKLPLCVQFDESKQNQLQYETNRLNQQETSKSFITLTQVLYEEIEGDLQFNQKIIRQFPFSMYLIIVFKNSDFYYPIFCIINLLLSILHIMVNFQLYSTITTFQSFQEQAFVLYEPLTPLHDILFLFQLINLTQCTFLMMFLVVKKIPFYFILHLKRYHKLGPKQKVGVYKYQFGYGLINLIKTVFLDVYILFFGSMTLIHPVFSTFVLLYFVTKLQIGRVLIKMIRALYGQLLVMIGVMVVFNYCYAMFVYVNLTVNTSYGAICVNLYACIKLLIDQVIKGGFVTLLPTNYINKTISLQFFFEISYNILVSGVMIEIFRGINFDKMSYFRQKLQAIQKGQKEKCYICGQKQFEIDVLLQGFERHLNHTHNRLNYVAFMFYLRRKKREKYMFYEDLVSNCLASGKYSWIPFETSIRNQQITGSQADNEPFQVKIMISLQEKQTQARKILAHAKKTKRQIRKYLQIPQDQVIRMSPESPSSPDRSRVNYSKQFKSN